MAVSGAMRDVVNMLAGAGRTDWGFTDHALGYLTVYWLEIVLLVVTVVAVWPLLRKSQTAERRSAGRSTESDVVAAPGNTESTA